MHILKYHDLSAMSVSSFVEFQQIAHINYLLTLPLLSTIALATPILWLVMLRTRRDGRAVAIGYAITLVFNVPVNNQLETWNASAPPRMRVRSGAIGTRLTSYGQFSGSSGFSSK